MVLVLELWILRVEICVVDFDEVSVMSLYLPSGTNLARLEFKLNYMAQFQEYISELKKDNSKLGNLRRL